MLLPPPTREREVNKQAVTLGQQEQVSQVNAPKTANEDRGNLRPTFSEPSTSHFSLGWQHTWLQPVATDAAWMRNSRHLRIALSSNKGRAHAFKSTPRKAMCSNNLVYNSLRAARLAGTLVHKLQQKLVQVINCRIRKPEAVGCTVDCIEQKELQGQQLVVNVGT